ncbi:hypothetical protein [Xylocopilactobacillus apicola]|uniref:Uncharacterized protein n=1 Tax=Xylocopilactobacillus apicola TaxID=2932184 RepID=A0AAU9DAX6_9LACO|nr:hypothetical protein [Xylocopilactobacillus apicola]BDR58705.1 hypothetical protein XA3_11460 [Xylocopilactobacillus apicola]
MIFAIKIAFVLISAFMLYSVHAKIKQQKKFTLQALTALVLICTTAGLGGVNNSPGPHYTANEVSNIKAHYNDEKSRSKSLKTADKEADKELLKAQNDRKKAELAYNKQKPEFEKEEKERRQAAEEKEKQEAAAKEEQKKQQEEEEKQKQLAAEQQAQKEQEQQRAAAQASAQSQQAQNEQKKEDPQGAMVWIAPTSGKRYHFDPNCRGLNRAKSTTQMTKDNAVAQGYTLCGFEGG